MKNIETGVDKLVTLINERKKISVDDAAKILGVSKVLVQEWADFLEQDGLISVEYSLSKIYLVERKLSKIEIDKKTKEYTGKKESFIRKVETTLQSLEKDTLGFEKMKEEFDKLKKQIGGEIDAVKKDFKELEYYENLKKNIDKDIDLQKTEYQKLMQSSHQEIKTEERRYREMLARVEQERFKVAKDKKTVQTLESQEGLIAQKITELNDILDKIRKTAKKEEQEIELSESNLKKLEIYVEQIEQRLKNKKNDTLQPLIKLSEEHSTKIFNLQDKILENLKQKKEELDTFKGQKNKVYKDLKSFFQKKEQAEKLLLSIDTKKKSLAKEYEDLIKKAQAFNALNKDSTVKKHITEMETEYKKVEEHKLSIREEIRKLTSLIRGG
jgi:predicted  nucleic acid-binding Zn-ribbon protein